MAVVHGTKCGTDRHADHADPDGKGLVKCPGSAAEAVRLPLSSRTPVRKENAKRAIMRHLSSQFASGQMENFRYYSGAAPTGR